jgi:hypothetical protein
LNVELELELLLEELGDDGDTGSGHSIAMLANISAIEFSISPSFWEAKENLFTKSIDTASPLIMALPSERLQARVSGDAIRIRSKKQKLQRHLTSDRK